MTNTDRTLTVLRGTAHGISIRELGRELDESLTTWDVRIARTPQEELELVRDATVVAGISIDEELVDAAENLRYFACGAAGTEHLPMEALEERDVAVTNAGGVHVPNIAEHVIGCMLVFTRRLDEGIRRQSRREWRQYKAFGELAGSTVTVVGLGSIGRSIVERLEPFDVETIGVRYTPSNGGPTDRVIGFDSGPFHDALADTDYLVLACPLTETTRGLVGADEFETLPPDVTLVNVGRGPLVDTDALLTAVRGNKIHAAALDVTDPEPLPEDHPLWNFDNVLITPHVSGHTEQYWERTAGIITRNVDHAEESGEFSDLENQVLTPSE